VVVRRYGFRPNSYVPKLPIFEELITNVSEIAASTLEAATDGAFY